MRVTHKLPPNFQILKIEEIYLPIGWNIRHGSVKTPRAQVLDVLCR
jgi:hypothetical protein